MLWMFFLSSFNQQSSRLESLLVTYLFFIKKFPAQKEFLVLFHLDLDLESNNHHN